ncbi:hypothetical protein LLH06_09630 [Mucilaginibacter daejeonensis]|uniref:hypothetical protein n=1 Tax=Mucilaginibacter daejeonensis TaxID=398049 RepID=UPI001D179FD8|nr:hypothetical protein [Mucilaginibacter daejeonensis]UEG55218.1 hypothetical protein LLH06_09630 [Mucilaginibacter daejeonensis]
MNNNNKFAPIKDAYQLVQGAKIKGIKHEEVFELGHYDADKRGYTIYPYEDGIKFDDFSVIVNERELKTYYLIEEIKVTAPMLENRSMVSGMDRLGMAS